MFQLTDSLNGKDVYILPKIFFKKSLFFIDFEIKLIHD